MKTIGRRASRHPASSPDGGDPWRWWRYKTTMPAHIDLADATVFLEVVRAGGFRQAARALNKSSSGLSAAVRRLERRLDTRLLHRTTRSVTPTERGRALIERLGPALAEADAALQEARGTSEAPAGALRLNVPVSVAKLILPRIVAGFLAAHPGIRLEVVAESTLVDVLAAEFDAGVRYDDRLPKDMVAVPIGPRRQRFATVAAPAYLARAGRPRHPADLARHACLPDRTANGNIPTWEFERGGERIIVAPDGPLITGRGATAELAVSAAVAGIGVLHIFEDWVRPQIDTGALVPILEDWWQDFSGPYLYFSGGRLMPPPLRAFIDFVKAMRDEEAFGNG